VNGLRAKKAFLHEETRWLLWLEDTSKRTSLAVQQQRFDNDSNADQVKRWCFGIPASIRASSRPIYKEHS
jgi:hypothetical protein